ncbi:unnamed protein product, partial [Mesorhabditis spiculigera]
MLESARRDVGRWLRTCVRGEGVHLDLYTKQEPTRTVSNSNQKLRYTKVRDAVAGGMASVNAEPFFTASSRSNETSKYFDGTGYSRTNRVYYLHEYCFNTAQVEVSPKLFHSSSSLALREWRTTNPHIASASTLQFSLLVSYHRDFHVSLDRFADKFIVTRSVRLNQYRAPRDLPRADPTVSRVLGRSLVSLPYKCRICIKALGDGAFGEVFKAYYRAGVFLRVPVAVKITGADQRRYGGAGVPPAVPCSTPKQPLDEKHPNKVLSERKWGTRNFSARCPPIAELHPLETLAMIIQQLNCNLTAFRAVEQERRKIVMAEREGGRARRSGSRSCRPSAAKSTPSD